MIKVAIVGYGNVGKAAYEALSQAKDMKLEYIVENNIEIKHAPVLKDVSQLKDVDVAILSLPSPMAPDVAAELLAKGISTVDCYDIHSSICEVRNRLGKIAAEHGTKAITAAGWDPGSDSVIRALSEAMIPKGLTYVNFGPGMSMGHSVAAKAVKGVKDALSMTIPMGAGVHRRMVYIELEESANFAEVEKALKQDPYFAHDETYVTQVESVDILKDVGHGVNLIRKGVSGTTSNQKIEFSMSINNPALTGQILVSCARAVLKQAPGCYTMIEIPPLNYLAGETDDLIRRLV